MTRSCASLALSNAGSAACIEWTSQTKTDIARLAKRDSIRIKRAIQRFADTEYGDCQRIRGFDPPHHRPTVGDWRVRFLRQKGVIRVLRVGHRREAYRKSSWVHQDVPGS